MACHKTSQLTLPIGKLWLVNLQHIDRASPMRCSKDKFRVNSDLMTDTVLVSLDVTCSLVYLPVPMFDYSWCRVDDSLLISAQFTEKEYDDLTPSMSNSYEC